MNLKKVHLTVNVIVDSFPLKESYPLKKSGHHGANSSSQTAMKLSHTNDIRNNGQKMLALWCWVTVTGFGRTQPAVLSTVPF